MKFVLHDEGTEFLHRSTMYKLFGGGKGFSQWIGRSARAFLCTRQDRTNTERIQKLPVAAGRVLQIRALVLGGAHFVRSIKGQLLFLSAPDADVTFLFAPRKSIRFR